MRYRLLRRVHAWLAMILAAPLIVLSLTGALLVYAPELQRSFGGAGWQVEPAGAALAPAAILARIAEQKPEARVWSLALADAPDRPWTAYLSGGAGVLNIDPHDGRILLHVRPKDTFQGWVTALHRRLLVDGPAAPWVRHGVSAVALLLLVQLGLGLGLWLKPPRPLRRLGVPLRFGARLAVLRLHQLAGVATAMILLAVAITGVAMWWHAPAKWLVELTTAERVAEGHQDRFEGQAPLRDLGVGLTMAVDAAGPGARIRHVRLPRHAGDPLFVTMRESGLAVPTQVWVGDAPPRVLKVVDGRDANLATWIWHIRYRIHVGDFAGTVVRALWVLVALLPAAFVLSGLWLHAGRRRRERRARAERGSTGSAAVSYR